MMAVPRSEVRAPRPRFLHPVLMMAGILLFAIALTYLLDAGQFRRHGIMVEPGSYQQIEKHNDPWLFFSLAMPKSTVEQAYPATVMSLFRAIPDGLSKTSELIFMVMFVGGMFEVFKRTGALDAGLDRLLHLSRGNLYVLAPLLIAVIGLGSTLLGLMSEYLVLLPIVLALGERLRISPLLALSMLVLGAKLGYLASVSNPIVLPVAQSIAGVPLFSGAGLRLLVFVLMILLAIVYFLCRLRRCAYQVCPVPQALTPLTRGHAMVLVVILAATLTLIWAAPVFKWHSGELSAFYLCLSMVIAIVGKLQASQAADAFVQGMKEMMLAALLIGLAATIELILQRSMVLDTVIDKLSLLVAGQTRSVAACGIMGIEALLDLLVPSTSGKAALSMPILVPIAHVAGLSGQICVLAFLLGNGIMGIINPSSGLTLAFLAIAKVSYGQWLRFALPLVLLLTAVAVTILVLAVEMAY